MNKETFYLFLIWPRLTSCWVKKPCGTGMSMFNDALNFASYFHHTVNIMLWSSTCHSEMDISVLNQSLLSNTSWLNVYDGLRADIDKTQTYFRWGKSVDFQTSSATHIAAGGFKGLKFVTYAWWSPLLIIKKYETYKNICAQFMYICLKKVY